MARKRKTRRVAGLPVDAYGGQTIDPTANVIALVKAEALSAAKLRKADTKFNDAEASHLKEMAALRAAHAETLRVSDLDRLDKTRQVDVLAGNTAAERALVAIQTLATTQAAAAETLRSMVTTTATTIATQSSQQMTAFSERIAALEKSSYEGAGKQAVSDPMIAELAAAQKRTNDILLTLAGQKQGGVDMRVWIGWAIALLVGLFALYNAARGRG